MAIRCADIHGGGSRQLGVLASQEPENRGGMPEILEVSPHPNFKSSGPWSWNGDTHVRVIFSPILVDSL